MSSARTALRRPRSSMRSPTAAAMPTLAAAEPVDVPAARKLALIVRPALIAGPGKVFVWSDWSAIEARITPWLAASQGAEKVLDIFRANDRDPSRPDIYTHRRRRHPAQGPERDNEDGTQHRQGGHAGARLWRLRRRAAAHGAELPHSASMTPRRAASSTPGARRTRGRGNSGAPTATAKASACGAPRCAPGRSRPDHHGGPDRLRLPRGLSRRRRCSWRCRRAAC